VAFNDHHHLTAYTLFPNKNVTRFVNLDRNSFDKTSNCVPIAIFEHCRVIQLHVKHQKIYFGLVSAFRWFCSKSLDWNESTALKFLKLLTFVHFLSLSINDFLSYRSIEKWAVFYVFDKFYAWLI